MCGIIGTYGNASQNLNSALDAMSHRGPDGRNIVYRDESMLAHTRLAIVDVEGGQQPLIGADDRHLMVCNGEIYNHQILRSQHTAYPFKTRSDNEIILALYAEYGPEAVTYLDGMFAFALVDEEKGLLLARDPLGIKPLYYGRQNGALYFASEIKGLQGYVDSIHEFPPGHWYTSADGFVQYYDVPTVADQARKNTASDKLPSLNKIRDTLQQAVRKRMMSDVPLGVFLSGGLDSSIVSAMVCADMLGVHSFSVGMEGSGDAHFAHQVADFLGTQHHEYIFTVDEMVEILPDVIYHLESFDPPLVRSAIPNFFLTRLATEHVTVVLSGEGADELFSGYHYLKDIDGDALHGTLVEITSALHNCNLQRLDRMAMAHSLEGRVPFLDMDFVALSFAVPISQKIRGSQNIEKWALRKACEDLLPEDIVWRTKEKFSEGAGSAYAMAQIAEQEIDDHTFADDAKQVFEETGYRLRTKEELYYYRIFREFFGPNITSLVGKWPGQ